MIKMIVSLKEKDVKYYKQFLEPSAKKYKLYLFQAVTKDGTNDEGDCKKFNLAVEAMFSNNMAEDNDIIVFVHDDIGIVDSFFKEKLELIFNEKPEIGIVGIMGSNQISDSMEWWMNPPENLRGHILQGTSADPGKGEHLIKGPIGFYDDVVSIDKCCFAIRASLLRELTFDDTILKDDFYNTDICLQVLSKGYKIAVADILLHQARIQINKCEEPEWHVTRKHLIEKWKQYPLPITINNFNDITISEIKRPEVMDIEI